MAGLNKRMQSNFRRGKPINGQAREIVHNVYRYCLSEVNIFGKKAHDGYFNKVQERAVKAAGISRGSLVKLLYEKDELGTSAFKTPAKGRPKITFRLNLDHFDYSAIRNMIYDIQLNTQEEISIKSLLNKVTVELGYQGCKETFCKILKGLGFSFIKTQMTRNLLVENYQIRLRRLNFIRDIQSLRDSGRIIVYLLDETYVHAPEVNGKPPTKSELIKVIYAGTEKGFIPGTLLLQQCKRKEMDSEAFMTWVFNQLIPNLPPDSVLVIDEAPCHSELWVEPPKAYSQKSHMIHWLEDYGIPFDKNSTKSELYVIIQAEKDKYTEFKLDRTIKDCGHLVMRLPQHHPDFNPMKTVWFQIKEFVVKNSVAPMYLPAVEQLLMEKMYTFKPHDWKKFFDDAITCEEGYRQFETKFDRYSDKFVVNNDANTDSDQEMSGEEDSSDS